jgi:hypothetical protein
LKTRDGTVTPDIWNKATQSLGLTFDESVIREAKSRAFPQANYGSFLEAAPDLVSLLSPVTSSMHDHAKSLYGENAHPKAWRDAKKWADIVGAATGKTPEVRERTWADFLSPQY